ncbi:MAG: Ada metal-binding domain-containing protein [Sneathiella sp.]
MSVGGLQYSSLTDSPFSDLTNRLVWHCASWVAKFRFMLDFETCNTARLRRDPSFDGRFFTAVSTTRIYCRPVCPAKHSLTKNVSYYPTAAAAERAGYRPCLRCRPETAPFCAAWNGTRTTVERALRLIDEGALDAGNVNDLADRLGVGARHLSRLFAKHIGASPLQTAQTLRIGRAKKLLDTTTLPITDIAFQAGFGSVRRFNATFSKLYGRPPSSIPRPKR